MKVTGMDKPCCLPPLLFHWFEYYAWNSSSHLNTYKYVPNTALDIICCIYEIQI